MLHFEGFRADVAERKVQEDRHGVVVVRETASSGWVQAEY